MYKELAEEFNVTPMYLGRLRRKLFPQSMEWQDDMEHDMRVYLAEMQEAKADIAKSLLPRIIKAIMVDKVPARPQVALFMLHETREKVWALVPKDLCLARMKGKITKLEEVEYEGKRYFRHATLAGRVFPPAFKKYGY